MAHGCPFRFPGLRAGSYPRRTGILDPSGTDVRSRHQHLAIIARAPPSPRPRRPAFSRKPWNRTPRKAQPSPCPLRERPRSTLAGHRETFSTSTESRCIPPPRRSVSDSSSRHIQAGSPNHLVLYDGQGNVLGDQPLPLSYSGMSVLLTALSKQGPEQTIYLGVYCTPSGTTATSGYAADSSAGSSSSAVPYVLDVSLIDNTSSPASAKPGSASSADAYFSATPLEPAQSGAGIDPWAGSAGPSSSASLAMAPVSLALTQSVGVPQQTGASGPAIRPSTWRSVAPLGSALTTRSMTRGVDRRAGPTSTSTSSPCPKRSRPTDLPSTT